LGIDNTIFNNIKKTQSKRIKFAVIWSVVFVKGVRILIDAFKGIEDATLDLYGPVGEDIKSKVIKFIKNKNIQFKGKFNYQEIKDIFSNIDILIVPSICVENSPLVIREAFATKTPIIASDIGGLSEMIQDGETKITI
jgi:glycosyltransferase involved in cell wall biosynthesis